MKVSKQQTTRQIERFSLSVPKTKLMTLVKREYALTHIKKKIDL